MMENSGDMNRPVNWWLLHGSRELSAAINYLVSSGVRNKLNSKLHDSIVTALSPERLIHNTLHTMKSRWKIEEVENEAQ